jgi:hypothetical protein
MAETAIKHSEFDENYFAMIVANPYIDGLNINPICSFPQSYNGRTLYTPKDENLKNAHFLDFLINNHSLYVRERIKNKLDEAIPTKENARGYGGTMFFEGGTYYKSEDKYDLYYEIYTPMYKFLEKKIFA